MGDSWHAFKTGFARTRQKVLAKVGQAEVTKSPEYDAECQKILGLQRSVKKIHENAARYTEVMKALIAEQEAMAQDILLLAEIGGVQLQVSGAMEVERDKMAAEFSQYFDTTILGYLHQFKELKDRMDELEIRRVDMDRYFRDYNSVMSKSHPDPAAVTRIETKYNVTKEGYQSLFNELMQDMPRLLLDRPRFFDPILASFAITHGNFYHTAAKALDDALPSVAEINEEGIHTHKSPITPNESSAKYKVYRSIGGAPAAGGENPTSSAAPTYTPPPSSFTSPQPTFSSSTTPSSTPSSTPAPQSTPSVPPTSSIVTPTTPPSAKPSSVVTPSAPPSSTVVTPSHAPSSSTSSLPSPSPSSSTTSISSVSSTPSSIAPPSPAGSRVHKVKASFDFIAQEDGELSFKKGDIITIVDDDGDWWVGELNGKTGTLPSNYVNPI